MHTVPVVHVCVLVHGPLDAVKREGGNLLQGANCHVLQPQLLPCLKQLVVDLAGAEHEALHLLWVLGNLRVPLVIHPQETRARPEVREWAHAQPVPEEVLRRRHDKRLPEVPALLPAQGVEVVGGRGDVHDLPVFLLALLPAKVVLKAGDVVLVVVAELQETLKSAGGVLRALTSVAVRQQHHEPGLLEPLVLAGGDELVEYDLRSVGKVAKLGLPDYEGVGVLIAVTQLKAKHAILSKDRVPCNEALLRAKVQVVEEAVVCTRVLVLDDAVPVRKCPALDVLTRQAHVVALQEQGPEGHAFCSGPVDRHAALNVLPLFLELPLEAVVRLEPGRDFA
mmetsp:Transcript_78622/g.222264  ORF Transcript_78622/g.222264 Transcript_78622/m.222264 type:complete len:337 (-) Transcript_78622:1437-2447(-)